MVLEVQVALTLLLWLVLAPAGSVTGFTLQAAGTVASFLRWRGWRNGRRPVGLRAGAPNA